MHQHIIEGTWSEVSKQMAGLGADARVRLKVIEVRAGEMMKKGMFPQLNDLTEADFKGPEFRDSPERF